MATKLNEAEKLPVDPETNTRYSCLDQINSEWWRQVATLVSTGTDRTGEIFKITDNCLEMPWFNRIVSINPAIKSMTYLNDSIFKPGYQDGLVIMALLNYLTKHSQLPPDTALINENHLTGGTTFSGVPTRWQQLTWPNILEIKKKSS